MNSKAYLIINLHAHLPYVHHPKKNYVEENWFFEAVVESYIPLIKMLENLSSDGIRPGLTFSLSPTLCAMLENDGLEKKLKKYINSRLELIEKEYASSEDEKLHKVLKIYQNLYEQAGEMVVKYSGDLITPLKQFQHLKQVELITTSATHAVLPLMMRKEAVSAQIAAAVEDYTDRFNRKPSGFWLPECAYFPGVLETLKINNLKYFFLESNGLDADARYGVFSMYSASNGINFLPRDSRASMEVWSSQFGYPGNPAYREFYRDIGYDRGIDYLKPHTGSEIRVPTGLKYYKVTGKNTALSEKKYYDYDDAMKAVDADSSDFLARRVTEAEEAEAKFGIRPLMVNCYDAELFGHWWFEGPSFLESVIRKIRQERFPLQIVTPEEYLDISRQPPASEPLISSWGENGYFDPWINEKNDFIYPKIHDINERIIDLANRFRNRDMNNALSRALNQAAREVLLLQSSDLPFLMYTGSHASYARERFEAHLANADRLIKEIIENRIDEIFLKNLEEENSIFPRMDFRIFCSGSDF